VQVAAVGVDGTDRELLHGEYGEAPPGDDHLTHRPRIARPRRGSRTLSIDASHLNLEMVLANRLVFGTVNANRRHFESGVSHLQAIEGRWPGLLDLKVVVDVEGGAPD